MEHRAMLYNKDHGAQRIVIYYRTWKIEQSYILYSVEHSALLYNIGHGAYAMLYNIQHGALRNVI